MTSRIPPQNLEAERAVLGAMLTDAAVIPEIASILHPADFYLPSHQIICAAILSLWNRREPVDLITVTDALKKTEQDISTADMAAMADLALPSHAKAHARAVKEAAQKRKLLEVIREVEEDLYSPSHDALSVAGCLSSALSSLQNGGPKSFAHIGDVLVKTVKQIEESHSKGDLVTGIPTGLKDLDERIGGIHPGELVVIAGRPGMGKTALGGTIAEGAAQRGYPVAFVTAETPAPKITQRLLAKASGLENRDLRRGRISNEQLISLVAKAGVLGDLSLWFLDSDRSWDRIKAKIRALKLREARLSLVVLDYVGLFSAPVPGGERYLEIGRISSEAKGLAIELELALVLLSQLNREVENRLDKRPKLSDLRESGCLEQDADIVGLLYRPVYYDENFRPAELGEFDVAKNRDGATGRIKLRFDERTVSFSDWTEPQAGKDFSEAGEKRDWFLDGSKGLRPSRD